MRRPVIGDIVRITADKNRVQGVTGYLLPGAIGRVEEVSGFESPVLAGLYTVRVHEMWYESQFYTVVRESLFLRVTDGIRSFFMWLLHCRLRHTFTG